MSKKFQQKEILPDPTYNSVLVAKFTNQMMKGGKKTVARKIISDSFDLIKKQTKKEPLEVFEKAIQAVAPRVEVRPRRVGGATYQVPMEVKEKRKISLTIRWLIGAARAKKGKSMAQRLAEELMAASQGEGEAIKKKINIEKMAAANRAFAHLGRPRKKKNA